MLFAMSRGKICERIVSTAYFRRLLFTSSVHRRPLSLVLITPRTLMLRLAGRGTGTSSSSSGASDRATTHSSSLYADDEDDESARAAAAAAEACGVWEHPDLWRLVPPPHADAPYDDNSAGISATTSATAATGSAADAATNNASAAAASAAAAPASVEALSPPLSVERRATWAALETLAWRRAPAPLLAAATAAMSGAKPAVAHPKAVAASASAAAAIKAIDDDGVDSVCAALWIEPLVEWLASDEVRDCFVSSGLAYWMVSFLSNFMGEG
jgi:hypothetical protein